MERIFILGVPLDNLRASELKKKLLYLLIHRRGSQIVTPNPEFLLLAQKDQEFFSTLREAELSIPDGIGLKFAAFLKGKLLHRFAGANVMKGLLNLAEADGYRVAVVNWDKGFSSDEEIRQSILKKHPRLQLWIGSTSRKIEGYNLRPLQDFKPDLLFVGLGAPWQDIFITRYRRQLPSVRLAMGLGGSFDYLTGKRRRAPKIMQMFGFEWLWRLLIQPDRFKRIWNAVIVFPLRVIGWEFRQFRYRPNVAAMIINRFGEVLILNARGRGDYWGLPQGGVERREPLEQAMRREIEEETGLTDLKVVRRFDNVYKYNWPKPYTRHGYKGQRQSLFVVRYFGPRQAVRTNPLEHKGHRWVKINELLKKASPVHKKQYEIFLEKYRQTLPQRKT